MVASSDFVTLLQGEPGSPPSGCICPAVLAASVGRHKALDWNERPKKVCSLSFSLCSYITSAQNYLNRQFKKHVEFQGIAPC